jgi:multidrug efflux pump subunit AcrA (membrane-fusion protein)
MQFIRLRFASIVAFNISAVLIALAAGCSGQSTASSDQSTQASTPETPVVKVVHPEKKDVRRLIERPGYNIQAFERTALFAKIAGYIAKWNVDIGDTVREGDILAELYIPEMTVELKQKEAAVRQASSEIKQAEAAILRAQAELERAKSQYARLDRAGRSGVLDKDQVDETRLGFEAAQAAVAKAHADVDVAKARLDVTEADRDHVQTLLQYIQVKAPFDGVITRRTVNRGDFVQPAAASKGEALFVIDRIKPVRVFVDVAELDAVWVREGDMVLLRAQALPNQQFKGTVTRTSKSMDRQNRNLRVEIDLPNEDGKLFPGMYMNATITAEHKNVWTLPTTAIRSQGEQNFCFRVENGKAVQTPIQVGLRGTELIEVLKKRSTPLKPGEQVGWENFTGDETIVIDSSAVTEGQTVPSSSKD